MKRCPECGRDYNDDSLSFCLDDGSELLFGPATDEPRTAILHETAPNAEAATLVQTQITEPTAILPSRIADIPKTKGRDKRLILGALALAVILIGGFIGYRYFKPATSDQINSIAVMLFQNASGDQSMDYLSDGVAESLTNSLSRLGQLKVMAASTMYRFKGRESEPLAVGKELGVAAVLTGKILQQGNRMVDLVRRVGLPD